MENIVNALSLSRTWYSDDNVEHRAPCMPSDTTLFTTSRAEFSTPFEEQLSLHRNPLVLERCEYLLLPQIA